LRLRKLAVDYDPYDRISALTYRSSATRRTRSSPGDMQEFLDTVEAPLNALGEAELCPGPDALTRFNAAHR
jgi:2-oxoglutarate ferredoxin oxidoreductase subunit beta